MVARPGVGHLTAGRTRAYTRAVQSRRRLIKVALLIPAIASLALLPPGAIAGKDAPADTVTTTERALKPDAPPAGASGSFRCADYQTQSEAQRAWEQQGRPDRSARDGDGDGKVCESLPQSPESDTGCKRSRAAVTVTFSRREYPNHADHIADVLRSKRYPRVWRIDRKNAEEHRDESINHWERTRGRRFSRAERRGKQRDEVPFATANVGGHWRSPSGKVRYASVRLIPARENSSSGSSLGAQIRDYCNGQRFIVRIVR